VRNSSVLQLCAQKYGCIAFIANSNDHRQIWVL
jgi:hypothetical protein